ncbi:efflux RND transporter periplasmic adaptor subunit [Bizionia sp. KMM 8389]
MKKIQYKFIVLLAVSLLFVACGNKDKSSKDDGHGHDESTEEADGHEEKPKEEHGEEGEGEGEELMLTAKQFDALKMKVDTLSLRNLSGYVEANGTLEVPPQSKAAVTSVVGSNVVLINVIEGDKVSKGEILAYLAHPNIIKMQTDYLNASSNTVFLKKNYERQQKLYDAGVGSGANFQKAKAEYDVSKALSNGLAAQLRILNINPSVVSNGTIAQKVSLLSPISGVVQKVEVKTGQYVDPQTELFEIVNTEDVHADLMVFEKDVMKVIEGQKVALNIQSAPDENLVAKIYSVGKTFELNPKAVHVHAKIENKTKGKTLIPGMYITGKIQVENIKTTALPESAITNDGDKFYVFSAEQEGDEWHFKQIEVFVSTKDDNWVEVKFAEELEKNIKFAYNNAYYLLAEIKKGEAEHTH